MKLRYLLIGMIFLVSVECRAKVEILPFTGLCDDTDIVINNLFNKYKEIPLIVGNTNDKAESKMSLWVNLETAEWTILATKNKISCVIGTGDSLEITISSKSNI
jgi:hypothetical protein